MAFSNSDLDVSLYFDLDNNRFRLKDNSDYAGASPAIALADVVGVYTLTDPNSNILHQNVDFDSPDIDLDSSLYSSYVSFTPTDGDYTLLYSVYDSDTITTYTKSFTFTYDADDIPDVVIGIESNVGLATIEATDETAYGATITLNSRTHTLTYPSTWGSTTSTSILVDTISLTDLYTGEYSDTITSDITITGTDNLILEKTITGTQTHDVWDQDGYYAVRTALDTFYDRWTTAQTDNPKKGREYAEKWNKISANYGMYNAHKQNGDLENAGEYLNNIKTLLAAEGIDTTIDPSVSVPVTASIPGYAAQWLSGSGAPAASLGRIVDFYYREDTNGIYSKATGSWVLIGTAGANTIIEFSADGATGWTTTYANGLNYIRFSGNGGITWTVAAKFIDGYYYYAYASDDSGTDFICNDNPTFIFNPVLEYIAIKKFSSSHNGDLVAGDFSGLFTKYRDNGIIAYCTTPSVGISTDSDGNNPIFPATNPKVLVQDGENDVTSNWTVAISDTTGVTASIVSDNQVDITGISANVGSIEITCSRSGYDDLQVIIAVFKSKDAATNINLSSIDNLTLEITDAYGRMGNITSISGMDKPSITKLDYRTIAYIDEGNHLLSTYRYDVDSKNFQLVGNTLDIGGTIVKPAISALNSTTIALIEETGDALTVYSWDGTDWTSVGTPLVRSGSDFALTKLDTNRIVLVDGVNIETYDWDIGTETWSKVGNTLDIETAGSATYGWTFSGLPSVTAIDSETVAYSIDAQSSLGTGVHIMIITFNGTNWSLNIASVGTEGQEGNVAVEYIGQDSSGYDNVLMSIGRDGVDSDNKLALWIWEGSGIFYLDDDVNLQSTTNCNASISILEILDIDAGELHVLRAEDGNNRLEFYNPFNPSIVYVGREGVREYTLSDGVFDGETITRDNDGKFLVDFVDLDKTFKKVSDSSEVFEVDYTEALFYAGGVAPLTETRIAILYADSPGGFYLKTIDYNNGIWSIVGNTSSSLTNFGTSGIKLENFGKNRVLAFGSPTPSWSTLEVFSFDGTNWSSDGSQLLDFTTGNLAVNCVTVVDDEHVIVALADQRTTGHITLRKYQFTGGSFSQVGNDFQIVDTSVTHSPNIDFQMEKINESYFYMYYYINATGLNYFGKFHFDGTNFTQVSSENIDLGAGISIKCLQDGTLLIWRDTTEKIYNYKYINGALHVLDSGTTLRASVDYGVINLMFDGKILGHYTGTSADTPVDLYFRYKFS
jgi:hypothetical protein